MPYIAARLSAPPMMLSANTAWPDNKPSARIADPEKTRVSVSLSFNAPSCSLRTLERILSLASESAARRTEAQAC